MDDKFRKLAFMMLPGKARFCLDMKRNWRKHIIWGERKKNKIWQEIVTNITSVVKAKTDGEFYDSKSWICLWYYMSVSELVNFFIAIISTGWPYLALYMLIVSTQLRGYCIPGPYVLKTLCIFSKNKAALDKVSNESD